MRPPGPGPFLLLVLTALPGVSRPADPILQELAAVPEPGLKAVRIRAVIRTAGLDRAVLLNLAVGARGASVRIEPGGDPSGTVVERVVYPARVKLWTPAKPVLYQLEAVLETRGRPTASSPPGRPRS